MPFASPSPWKDADLPATCLAWVEAVDRLMRRRYCIDLADAGADRAQVLAYWRWGEPPPDFVDWFGEKYDLIEYTDWLSRCALRRD